MSKTVPHPEECADLPSVEAHAGFVGVTPETQFDLPGSELAGTGSPAFPQQEGLCPSPASPRIPGLPSPAGGVATSNEASRSPGAAHLAFLSSVLSVPKFTLSVAQRGGHPHTAL